MGLNAHLHFVVDSVLLEKLKKEALERGMNVSELCRERLREGDRLERIEERLEGIERFLGKIKTSSQND
ncbi:MAG: hypothetical protein KJ600_06570 [Nanoarchaeota archaeon]|nr:hypothetical protein [Nanoarchaeota archaeon]MBU1104188.1 hypothetical protein [Nanoarchaeota archaeon]